MSYCVCQIHVLGVQCMVVISTTNCNVVLAHTLFLFLAPEMQGIFAIRVTIICMQLSDNFLHFTAMHINITVATIYTHDSWCNW